ncbi:MAG: Ig-like domain-containing protein [Lachnospiraceae bacterium]|nr:Ig-like domain-containing protein [Lachnospiraceae bacterium]
MKSGKVYSRIMKTLALILSMAMGLALFMPSFGLTAKADEADDFWGYVITWDDISLERGKSRDVDCSVHTNADSYVLYWSSSNEDVVSVQAYDFSDNARLYAMGEGTATITCSLRIAGMNVDNDSFRVTVGPDRSTSYVSGISINPGNVSINIGRPYQLQAFVYPTNAGNKDVTWESWDTSIAVVDSRGLVTGVNYGHTTIAARSVENSQIVGTCGVDVYGAAVAVQGVSLSQRALTLQANNSVRLGAAIYPSNATNKDIVWHSSNEYIASVYQDGTVYGYHAGSCVITAWTEDGGHTASCTVTVIGNSTVVPSASVPGAATAAQPATATHDPMFVYNTCAAILAAPQGGTAAVASARPLAYDANVANALKLRPDVTLVVTFPFNGHNFAMALPKGYNLSAKLDATGWVDFLVLCNYQNRPGEVQVAMIN